MFAQLQTSIVCSKNQFDEILLTLVILIADSTVPPINSFTLLSQCVLILLIANIANLKLSQSVENASQTKNYARKLIALILSYF